MRKENFVVEKVIFERSFKAQMKYADKIGAKYLLVIGENELMPSSFNFSEKTVGSIVAYSKD